MNVQASPLMELRNIGRSFRVRGEGLFKSESLRAVDGVTLDLRRGEVLAIVGESGSGKSTLGRMMLRLLVPSEGEIWLDGAPLTGLTPRVLSRLIQPVFQDPYSSLNARKTIEQIISLPLRVHGMGDRVGRRASLAAMMERVGLPPRLRNAYPVQLSGGQRQRVAIARALIVRPQIVVCDEPTSSLDVSVQAQIINLLKDLRDEFALTYVFISHDLSVVDCLADRVGVMYLGRLVEFGAAADVLRSPRHPYTRALLDSVLSRDPAQGLPDAGLGARMPDPLHPPSGCHFHPRCPQVMDACRDIAPKPLREARGMVECHRYGPAS
jgi:peptide/nickel transport system ATP-binding protein